MGRYLSWYIIPKQIDHDATKEICFKLESEPDQEDIEDLIYEHVHGKKEMQEHNTLPRSVEWFKKNNELRKSKLALSVEYRDNKSHKHKWCPKCLMFVNGLYDSPLVIAKKHISHSYSNPILDSEYDIKRMYMGSANTPFILLFSEEKMYREITKDDIDFAYEELGNMGNCDKEGDIEAKEEAHCVLDFLSLYADDTNLRMIIDDDY